MAVEVSASLNTRQVSARERLSSIRERLLAAGAELLLGDRACVYATGSMARGDASGHSDLDAFILSESTSNGEARLSNLNAIRLKARLIEAVAAEGLPEFSDDGKYLVVHTLDEMIKKLGTADDDYENLFTARMLLLLESSPLLGSSTYDNAVVKIIENYWADYAGNEDEFLPVFLTNDIIRYWKVLCLNYEAFTRGQNDEAKRRHQNYKLKHSRLLTCYSAIVYFLMLVRTQGSVAPKQAVEVTRIPPVLRLVETSKTLELAEVDASISRLLSMYATFLEVTDAPKGAVRRRFQEDSYNNDRRREAKLFGDEMFGLLKLVGQNTSLYRYLVV